MEPRHIFDGMTMIATRDHTGQWWKVVQHCVRCGECCNDRGPRWIFGMGEDLIGCRFLEEEESVYPFRCDLGGHRPLSCSLNSPFSGLEYCQVKFEKMTDEEATEFLLRVV